MEKYNFAIAKRWIEGEGHSYVLIFTANVLHGSWIFAMNEIAQKCRLHKRKVWSDSTCSNERQPRGSMVAVPFYLWFVKELCHFSIKLGVVFILLHLAKGSFFFTCLRFLKGSALAAQLMGSSFVLGMLAYEQSIL